MSDLLDPSVKSPDIMMDVALRMDRIIKHYGKPPRHLLLPQSKYLELEQLASDYLALYMSAGLGPGETVIMAAMRSMFRGRYGVEIEFVPWLDEPFAVPPTWSVRWPY